MDKITYDELVDHKMTKDEFRIALDKARSDAIDIYKTKLEYLVSIAQKQGLSDNDICSVLNEEIDND